MHTKAHAKVLGGGHNLLQEALVIAAQGRAINTVILGQSLAQACDVIAIKRTGQPGHNGGQKRVSVLFGRFLEPYSRFDTNFGAIVILRVFSPQHVDLKRRHPCRIKPQTGAAAGNGGSQIGTGPIQQRHEVIADGIDALRREIDH